MLCVADPWTMLCVWLRSLTIRAKKAKAAQEQQERAEKKYTEKLRLTEQQARQAEEKARNLEKAIGGASGSAADARPTKVELHQATLLREKELRVEVEEAERQREATLVEELRRQLQQQGQKQLELTAESAEERGRRLAAETRST
ncbi:hypothetical protein CYMTET_9353, partial [Cymbomonas tetramitiformis]